MTVTLFHHTAGWAAALLAAAGAWRLASGALGWLENRYELDLARNAMLRLHRRWYAAGCQVQFAADDPGDAFDYGVLAWTQVKTHIPWVLALIVGADQDDGALWVPVADLRPVSVPVFQPSVRHHRLFAQRPPKRPVAR
jgi:hypothetical protein